MTNAPKLTPLQAAEARRLAAEQAKANKVPQARSEQDRKFVSPSTHQAATVANGSLQLSMLVKR